MKQPSLRLNFIYRAFYEVLTILIPLITTPYISRVLGSDGVGVFSYTSSMMTFFTMFAALGTNTYGMREIAMHRDDPKTSSKLFWEIEIMTVFTSLVCLGGWLIASVLYKKYTVYMLALTPILLGTMFDINWYFTGHEKMLYTVLRNSLVKIISMILLFVLVKTKDDLMVYVLINSVAQLIGSLSMWTYLPKMLVRVNSRDFQFKRHFRETLIYFIPTIAVSIYTVLDKFLIGAITQNTYLNGYYEESYKIIRIIKTVVFTSVNTVMGARMSYLFAQKKFQEIHNRILHSLDFILFLGFGSVFGIVGIARNFVPVFLGPGWDPVITLLYLMSPLVLVIGVSNCLGSQYYSPSGRRAQSAKYIVAGSIVNLCLNLILIPRCGANGAVIASIVAELTITVLYMANCNGYLTVKNILERSYKRLVSGAVMCILIMIMGIKLPVAPIPCLLIQIISGVGIYLLILVVLKDKILYELWGIMIKCFRKVLRRV